MACEFHEGFARESKIREFRLQRSDTPRHVLNGASGPHRARVCSDKRRGSSKAKGRVVREGTVFLIAMGELGYSQHQPRPPVCVLRFPYYRRHDPRAPPHAASRFPFRFADNAESPGLAQDDPPTTRLAEAMVPDTVHG